MNPYRCIAAIAGLSCAIAGFVPAAGAGPMELAQAPDSSAPRPAPAADKSESRGIGWYVGAGIGPASGAKYKLNGQTITFSDRLETDKTALIALNLVNAGVALSPDLLLGLSVSAASQTGKIAGNDAHLQINNYLAAVTWFPAGQGFFVRGGGGLSNILIDTGAGSDVASGFGILVGAGYALRIAGSHNITFTVDYSRQSYNGSTTKPDNSQFAAAYLGYMYRH
jgi:hypothetical protein